MTIPFQNVALFGLLRKYRPLFLRYWRQLVLGVLALAATNLMGLAIPLQIKQAVDLIQTIFNGPSTKGALESGWSSFYEHLWVIAGLATLALGARIASRQFLLGAGRRLEFDLRNRLYAHLLKMPVSYFAVHPSGELMSRMTNDVDATKYLIGGGIMLGANTVLAYLLTIPMMLYLNWKLALVTFLFYPIVIFSMSKISKQVRQGYYQVQEVLADISTVAQENLNGMMVIQSYAREAHENKRFEKICDQYFSTYTRLIHERILLFMVLAGLSGLSMFLVLLVGGWQVIVKQLDWGGFVAFTMYLEQLAWPTMALGWTISVFQQGTAALERLDEVFSTESNIQSGLNAGGAAKREIQSSGLLEIRNLTFTYQNAYYQIKNETQPSIDTTPLKPALRAINLIVRPGETIGLVGSIGSGKSTLLRLLPRLLEVPVGTIFLEGQDITELNLEALRTSIVFMPQMSFLFSTTVSQNIAFGKPNIMQAQSNSPALPESDIVHAAEIASVHLDILDLPKQYQTLVGERGLMLSGGQRQRVSLARAIMMDAEFLILDDPFSNVDAETERNIITALNARKIFQNKTTLLATHRFSLVGLCDRVVLMDDGHIVATGTHAELLATQPLYQKLHRLQELRSSLGDWGLEASESAKPTAGFVDQADEDDEPEALTESAGEA